VGRGVRGAEGERAQGPGGNGIVRALIIYSKRGGIEPLAKAIASSLSEHAVRVDLQEADERTGGPVSAAPYDVICVGSPVLGFWRGEVAADVDATIKRFTRLEGRQAAAFVKPAIFGTGKALRRLMGILERQGAMVQDFAAIRGLAEARAFSRRLENLIRKKP